ncbi:hypothetical protein WICANDRAFT_77738 [Wickerhamomyces anomalus NRRL Y-366-8]|uniref:G10 protein n=1 Tax=Wickerhamomyces anomalus (strain ATCC 58044 / CBS 1984 / NCYC 433 / NRRL Y-366-8) TaxID=683960 RepID=A0A1E3P822_WICAA|nr:uncharacterized protein WICANDRAFT_83270 [Wickerhamomyces anomalus NRRL Y-366-8]XP_019040299.1 uncharacterized protein WICANDRAFT_77738 [Wickerhamomyces anomalus NRRL Y-366-8]ODQ61000.1 hypothetical protein WICANDRAFT_83270 [Wickerhamomyces anomalus NRRL Y-366-8]ODQ61092.1 hypothetical protein WICANDRAFT_77738 [Wickerhamomyces anomalus NRRL Y-366-8]
MAKIKSSRSKQPPDGYDSIKPTLDEFDNKMKDVQSKALTKSGRKSEALWDIFRVSHQRSRYVYEMYYKKKLISKELYDWCLKNRKIDANLIAKWKKQGYENLCCIKCIQGSENNNGGTCICRVPRATLEKHENVKFSECINCGCRGCASTD